MIIIQQKIQMKFNNLPTNNEGKTQVYNNLGLKMSEDISKNTDGSSLEASICHLCHQRK